MEETVEFYINNDLNSRISILDDSGDILESIKYDSWGNSSSLEALFTGKQLDSTGLYYFNARYYDPQTGRFLTEDPLKQGTSWYSYCSNNPINKYDPDGKDEHDMVIDFLKWAIPGYKSSEEVWEEKYPDQAAAIRNMTPEQRAYAERPLIWLAVTWTAASIVGQGMYDRAQLFSSFARDPGAPFTLKITNGINSMSLLVSAGKDSPYMSTTISFADQTRPLFTDFGMDLLGIEGAKVQTLFGIMNPAAKGLIKGRPFDFSATVMNVQMSEYALREMGLIGPKDSIKDFNPQQLAALAKASESKIGLVLWEDSPYVTMMKLMAGRDLYDVQFTGLGFVSTESLRINGFFILGNFSMSAEPKIPLQLSRTE